MNIIYLTLRFAGLKQRGIYPDLINELALNGHKITVVVAEEKKNINETKLEKYNDNVEILRVKVGDQFGVNFIKKGITTLKIQPLLKKAISKYLSDRNYDLVLYSTPPVTFANVVEYCKHKYQCKSYLMLKDIFPQNGVDIGLFKENGIIYKFFKKKEEKLYINSDFIGCMSKKNVEYILQNNPHLCKEKVELFPNTIKVPSNSYNTKESKNLYRKKYNIDDDKVVFVFGGNLGKPQGIDFLLNSIKELQDYTKAYFLIIGKGSEKNKVKEHLKGLKNARFIEYLPKDDYEQLIDECDIGLVLLDNRFTIPNYPSRMLSYMTMSMPMVAATDKNTDVRELLENEANCGLWCSSDDINEFIKCIKKISEDSNLRKTLGENGRKYLENNFDVSRSLKILEKHFTM